MIKKGKKASTEKTAEKIADKLVDKVNEQTVKTPKVKNKVKVKVKAKTKTAKEKAALTKKFKLAAYSKVVLQGSCNGIAAQNELAAEFRKHLLAEGKLEIESHTSEAGVTTKYVYLTK